jgi:hypothetical protein
MNPHGIPERQGMKQSKSQQAAIKWVQDLMDQQRWDECLRMFTGISMP